MATLPMPTNTQQGNPLDISLGDKDDHVAAAKTLIEYGDSGLGKSTEMEKAARYYYAKTGKPARLIAAEDSSKIIFEPLIRLGIVQPVFITKAKTPLVTLRKLSKGDWPVFDEAGNVKEWVPVEKWAGTISAYIHEGLTTEAEMLLEDARENHRFLREQKADSFEIGGEKFATASQTAFGFVQMEMIRHLKAFGMLPVERVLWTAHEAKGTDEGTLEPIRGAGLVGSAKTAAIQKYCGTMLHVDGVKDPKNPNIIVPRVYFKRHPDPKFPNISYPAKVTVPLYILHKLDKEFPLGYYEPTVTSGLDKFLEVEERLLSGATDDLSKWKAEVDAKHKAAA